MARLTGAQERIRHVDSVLTPSIVKLIRESAGTIEGKSWATALDVSLQTICRVRSGKRGAERNPNWGGYRKPMGGDRRSGR